MNKSFLHTTGAVINKSCLLKTLLLFFFFISVLISLKGQSYVLTIHDNITQQAVEFAHIQIRPLQKGPIQKHITDERGQIQLNLAPPFVLEISSLGFKNYTDTIKEAKNQTLLLSPAYYQLDHVVVTGQFRAQPVDNSIYNIEVIDRKQIDLKAANNLGDLLRNELNFQYRSEGVLGDFLRIRGLTGEHVKILIDGMPITGRMADKIELGQLSLSNIDHIEVIEGPMSVVYGSNALAGAINIITADHSQKRLVFNSDLYYETVGIYNLNLNASRHFKKHTLSGNIGRNYHNGWGPLDTSRYKIWKPKVQYIAGASYGYKSEQLKIQYHTDLMIEELRDKDSLSLENLYEKALDSYHYTNRWNNRFSLNNIYHEDFILNFQAGYSYYQKRKITYLNDLVNLEKNEVENPSLHDTTSFHLISSKAFISNQAGKKFEYQTGLDYSYEQAEGKRTQGQQSISDFAGFMNFIYRPWEILSFQPGARLIYNSKYKAPVVYALNLKLNPGNFIVHTSYAKGFRAPSLKQLYLEFIDNNHEIHGNPNLKSETGESANISTKYSYIFGKHTLDFAAGTFYNELQNAIQLVVNIDDPGWGTYFNISDDNIKTKGVEAQIHYHFFPRLNISSGMITTGRNQIDKPSEFVYSTDYTSSVKYHSPRYEYELAVYYKYTDEFQEFRGNFNEEGELIGIAQRSTSGYHTMDITLNKYFYDRSFIISLGVRNLFDVTQVDSYGNLNFHGSSGDTTPVAYGRTFFLKLAYRLTKY